jgi:hypothetical protein
LVSASMIFCLTSFIAFCLHTWRHFSSSRIDFSTQALHRALSFLDSWFLL